MIASVELGCCVTESSGSVLGVSAADGCRLIPCSQVTECGKQNEHSMSLRCSVNLEYLDYILSKFLFYALSPLGWEESIDRRILLAGLHIIVRLLVLFRKSVFRHTVTCISLLHSLFLEYYFRRRTNFMSFIHSAPNLGCSPHSYLFVFVFKSRPEY